MMIRIALIFSLAAFFGDVVPEPRVVKLPQLKEVLESKGDEIRVVNFWATWCGPCIKELPLFEKLAQQHPDIKVTLVSMDLVVDPNPEKVFKYVSRKKLQSTVLILDEPDPDYFIDQIEKDWSGAIPATIVLNSKTGKRVFVEAELHEGELEKLIDQVR